MSRGQETQVVNEAQDQNKQFNQNAQTSYNAAQGDVTDYKNQTAQFAAANPYKAGGEFQTSQNKVLANTADAASTAAGQAMQSNAVRTGLNSGAAVAGTEAVTQANTRDLSAQEAAQNAARISNEAGYNDKVLNATQVPAQLETTLSGQQGSEGNAALGIQEKGAETPSFMDTLGESFAKGFGGGMGSFASGQGGFGKPCWIAARLWGSWLDPRTVLFRVWLNFEFSRSWIGRHLFNLYAAYGERIADSMPSSLLLTAIASRIFEKGLEHAELWLLSSRGSRLHDRYWHILNSLNFYSDQVTTSKDLADKALLALMTMEKGKSTGHVVPNVILEVR